MTPKPKVASLADMKKKREIEAALAPSGLHYTIRPLNLERHALAGGLPAKLRAVAMQGAEGVNALLGSDDGKISDEGDGVRQYLDVLCAEVIVAPDLWLRGEDGEILLDENGQRRVDPESIDAVPPVDYKWAVAIAMGEEDEDGEGRRLWGREPLSRWASFREVHGCDPDCPECRELLDRFSSAQ